MALNLIRLHEICKDPMNMVNKLQQWKLIPQQGEYSCPKCKERLELRQYPSKPDGFLWVCLNKRYQQRAKTAFQNCNTTVAFRYGTWFACSHLSIFQHVAFINLWVDNVQLKVIMRQLDIGSSHTVVKLSTDCRELLFDAYVLKSSVDLEKLGGPGIKVQIDESKFGKRKYHRGHLVEGSWVFGGFEEGTGKLFMVVVPDRGRDTLLQVIKDWIKPETTIVSDYWRAYDCLNDEGYQHLKVNHSINFKDLETGVHTNHIEASWRAAKAITTSAGCKKAHIPGNLAKYMFNKVCATKGIDRNEEFFRIAGLYFNPLPTFLRFPAMKTSWKKICTKFFKKWNFHDLLLNA